MRAKWKSGKDLRTHGGIQTRQCFHPGTGVLPSERLSLGAHSPPPVTGVQMVEAMSGYIWPKVIKFKIFLGFL